MREAASIPYRKSGRSVLCQKYFCQTGSALPNFRAPLAIKLHIIDCHPPTPILLSGEILHQLLCLYASPFELE